MDAGETVKAFIFIVEVAVALVIMYLIAHVVLTAVVSAI